ncbi:hypothetical protein L226DRAFT_471403, partial [Lentinus tigrinus ALCF2SS1-7]|uniref:uncharacterized protein n=1 Tax=Lentinus tigrinus ALCF2SS1-7 TaxID=1328758 RepID=UPI0011660214
FFDRRRHQLPAHLTHYIDNAVRQSYLRQFTPRDHALAVDGACIVPNLSTRTETSPSRSHKPTSSHPAEVILRENLHGGSCWTLPASHGQVGIRLPHVIHPSSVTIDHLPKEILQDIGQAPRRMRLWGTLDGDVNAQLYGEALDQLHEGPPITEGYTFVHLADFEYDVYADHPIQTFPVQAHVYEKRLHIGVFVIELLDNWGSQETCLYRLRIHGDLV